MAENFSDLLKNKLHFGEAPKNKGRYTYLFDWKIINK